MYRQGNIVQHIPVLRGGGEGYFSLFNVAQAGLLSYHLPWGLPVAPKVSSIEPSFIALLVQ